MIGVPAGVLAAMWALGRHGVRAPWVFLLGFVILWFFVLRSGVHATIAGVLAAASYAGVPGMIGGAVAEQAGQAGLKVGRIEITGLKRMDRMSVYAVALEQESRAMPLVDLAAVREKLLRYGWIADAQVSRRLPDTLLVHIVERRG